jgi:hypothetical protein
MKRESKEGVLAGIKAATIKSNETPNISIMHFIFYDYIYQYV